MSHSPNGDEHGLVHGDQRAVVVELGAGLRSYRRGSIDIVDSYLPDEPCPGSRGQLLLPWPNRIAQGRYRFEGRSLQLPVNEPRTGSAIHGLARELPWRTRGITPNSVSLALDMRPVAGYPFALELEASYTLDDSGLTVRITARNPGPTRCPFGAGAHPYLRLATGGPVDDALLTVPGGVVLESDARGIPTGVLIPVEGTAFDFRSPRRIGATVLDTAFTGFDGGGITRISLASSGGGGGAVVWMDATYPYAMLYSGDTLADIQRRRRGLAIEPMTCAPDAFNSGAGLIVLEPGEIHEGVWGISSG